MRARGEEDLQLGIGEDDGSDVAPLDHVVAGIADAALLFEHGAAHGDMGGNRAHGPVDARGADFAAHIGPADGYNAGKHLAFHALEVDLVFAGDLTHRLGIGQIDTALERLPGDGAEHGSRIQAGEAQLGGDFLGYGGFAGARRPVNGDYHRVNLSMVFKNVG